MNNRQPEPKKPRMTRQRRSVLEAVQAAHAHPTADEVHRVVRRRLPRISLATVYRNLDLLSEHGLIRRLDVGGSQRRYDGTPGRHYHVRCVHCGRMDDVPIRPLANADRAARRATDYRIFGHRLEFVGLCARCRTEEAGGAEGAAARSANRAQR
jgi:Fur family ferric uptake transcriptional regulator